MKAEGRKTVTRLRILGGLGIPLTAFAFLVATTAPVAAQTRPAPKVGGEIRIDVPEEPIALDPLRFTTVDAQRLYRLAHNTVLKWREEDKSLEPDLAAAMPTVSPDRLAYTVKLRRGVKWHDGQPFDASDVKYTYEQVLKPENRSLHRASFPFVGSVEAPDPETVVVRLRAPHTQMLSKFAMVPIISAKIPYEPLKTYATRLVGTGPYKLVKWQPGVEFVFERNPDYFVKGKPYLQRIVVRIVKENVARVTNLANNQTHIVPEPPANQLELLRQRGAAVAVLRDSGVRLLLYTSFAEGRPTTDLNLRKAIAWAIDRQTIIDQVYAGTAVPASTVLISGLQYYDEKVGTFFGNRPDLAKAREFLGKLATPPRELNLLALNVPDVVEAATIIQSNLRAIGLRVAVTPETTSAIFPKIVSGQFDLFLFRSGNQTGFAPDLPFQALHSTAATNIQRFKDPKMDQLLMKAMAAPDGPEAQAAWRTIQEYDVETLGQIQVVTFRYIEAHGKTLQNYRPSALMLFTGLTDAFLP